MLIPHTVLAPAYCRLLLNAAFLVIWWLYGVDTSFFQKCVDVYRLSEPRHSFDRKFEKRFVHFWAFTVT